MAARKGRTATGRFKKGWTVRRSGNVTKCKLGKKSRACYTDGSGKRASYSRAARARKSLKRPKRRKSSAKRRKR